MSGADYSPTQEEITTMTYGPRPRRAVFRDVHQERCHQDKKHGTDRDQSELEWMNVLTEEVGEAAQALNDHHFAFKAGKITYEQYLWAMNEKYRPELIQVAAVAIAAVENFDRKVKEL